MTSEYRWERARGEDRSPSLARRRCQNFDSIAESVTRMESDKALRTALGSVDGKEFRLRPRLLELGYAYLSEPVHHQAAHSGFYPVLIPVRGD